MKKSLLFLFAFVLVLSGCTTGDGPIEAPADTPDPIEEENANETLQQADGPLGYAVAQEFTPVFYTPDLPSVFGYGTVDESELENLPWLEVQTEGNQLDIDAWGTIDQTEVNVFKGTVFEILEDMGNDIYKITASNDYPYCGDPENEKGCYVHAAFLGEITETRPEDREKILPSKEDVLAFFAEAEGADYVWGGNVAEGIPKLLELYPPKDEISESYQDLWTLKGFDCSGLLFAATNGYTPRNTSELVYFGEGVDIAGLTAEEIAAKLEPLDMLVWKGHSLYVYDDTQLIESIGDPVGDTDVIEEGRGVRFVNTLERLEEILESKVPANDYDDPIPEGDEREKNVVLRRWYPNE